LAIQKKLKNDLRKICVDITNCLDYCISQKVLVGSAYYRSGVGVNVFSDCEVLIDVFQASLKKCER